MVYVGAMVLLRSERREVDMGISERYLRVADKVAEACVKCGRNPERIKIIAVSKTVGLSGVRQAIEAGAHSFGENRPEQLMEKAKAFPDNDWNFIGNIQSRQINHIVSSASLIHSLYQLRHAEKISNAAKEMGKVQRVLLEVNVSGEESKSGVAPERAADLLAACNALEGISVCGLMTMAPQGDLKVAASCFSGLRQLGTELRKQLTGDQHAAFAQLSMGMSEDWQVAIEEGATMVRIGRAIFSDAFD